MANPLALLCDSITPIFVLAYFSLPWIHKKPAKPHFIVYRVVELSLGLISTYGLMVLDNTYHLWPVAGLDYSTHSAFALTFCLPLVRHQHWAWVLVLVLYAWLMHRLGYHSWADMFTTFLAWFAFTLLPLQVILHQCKKRLLIAV